MKAKDIKTCDDCPLNADCKGTVCYGDVVIDPPCASWNDDDEIYEGMYDCTEEFSDNTSLNKKKGTIDFNKYLVL